jgi:hypothetical protein
MARTDPWPAMAPKKRMGAFDLCGKAPPPLQYRDAAEPPQCQAVRCATRQQTAGLGWSSSTPPHTAVNPRKDAQQPAARDQGKEGSGARTCCQVEGQPLLQAVQPVQVAQQTQRGAQRSGCSVGLPPEVLECRPVHKRPPQRDLQWRGGCVLLLLSYSWWHILMGKWGFEKITGINCPGL